MPGVYKEDPFAACAGTRRRVERFIARLAGAPVHIVDILDFKGEVMQAGSPLAKEAGNRRSFVECFKQFELYGSARHERDMYPISFERFG